MHPGEQHQVPIALHDPVRRLRPRIFVACDTHAQFRHFYHTYSLFSRLFRPTYAYDSDQLRGLDPHNCVLIFTGTGDTHKVEYLRRMWYERLTVFGVDRETGIWYLPT